MSKRTRPDYTALIRELRPFVRGFEARDGFKLKGGKLSANDKRALTRAHKALGDRRMESHVVYRSKDRKAVRAVQRAAGETHPERYKVAFVSTPMPEKAKIVVRKKRDGTYSVAQKITTSKPKRGKAKSIVAYESRDWDPVRLMVDMEGEIRRLTRGDSPRTKYVFKAGKQLQWRMGFPVGRDKLLEDIRRFVNSYGGATPAALRDWATGFWAFDIPDKDFMALVRTQRDVREDVSKVRRRAKRIQTSRRARA